MGTLGSVAFRTPARRQEEADVTTYTVKADRVPGWWVLQAIDVPDAMSQVASLKDAEQIREAISLATGEQPSAIGLEFHFAVDAPPRGTYDVECSSDGKWWMVSIPALNGFTQGHDLAEAEEMAID